MPARQIHRHGRNRRRGRHLQRLHRRGLRYRRGRARSGQARQPRRHFPERQRGRPPGSGGPGRPLRRGCPAEPRRSGDRLSLRSAVPSGHEASGPDPAAVAASHHLQPVGSPHESGGGSVPDHRRLRAGVDSEIGTGPGRAGLQAGLGGPQPRRAGRTLHGGSELGDRGGGGPGPQLRVRPGAPQVRPVGSCGRRRGQPGRQCPADP